LGSKRLGSNCAASHFKLLRFDSTIVPGAAISRYRSIQVCYRCLRVGFQSPLEGTRTRMLVATFGASPATDEASSWYNCCQHEH
jgi:hypothetical protein